MILSWSENGNELLLMGSCLSWISHISLCQHLLLLSTSETIKLDTITDLC